jgi:hypothetical protein
VDQSQPGGNFMWLRKARAACSRWQASNDADVFEGWHDGYMALEDPVLHRRAIVLDQRERRVVIEDTLEMNGTHEVELFLHCHEACAVTQIAGGVRAARGARALEIRLPDACGGDVRVLNGSLDPIGGWISRAFDRKQSAPTIVWRARLAGRTRLKWAVQLPR